MVKRRVCLENGKLTNLEKQFLNQPAKYAKQLWNWYVNQLATSSSYANVAQEVKKLPELIMSDWRMRVDPLLA